MRKRRPNQAADELPRSAGWGERCKRWLRLFLPRERADERLSAADATPPLADDELASLVRSYLDRLYARQHTVYVYGLDARRRAMQQGGQQLDFFALYIPLNALVTQGPAEAGALAAGSPPTPGDARLQPGLHHPVSLLEVVSKEKRVLVRGRPSSFRSALLRFLALSLAERSPGNDHAGLARLEPTWTHGWMLPLWVDLGDLAASAHHDGTAEGLLACMAARLHMSPGQLQGQVIEPGQALFLLDGLESATEAVRDLARRFAHTASRFVVTAHERTGWAADPACPLEGFAEVEAAPLTAEQTDAFARQWYAGLERKGWVDEETARDAPGQLGISLRREGIWPLARRPSTLMLLTLLHTLRGRLPQSRVACYHELVNLATARWSEGGAEGERACPERSERDLRQIFDMEALGAAVAQATFHAHACLAHPADLVELPESDLRAAMVSVCQNGQWQAVDDLVSRIATRPGILEERRPGVFGYVHPSMRAYVAARHLAAQPDLPRMAARLAREDLHRWREVIVFAVGRLAHLAHNLPAAIEVIEALLPHLPPADRDQITAAGWRMAWLAGELLAQVAAGEQEQASQLQDRAPATLNRTRRWLAALVDQGRLTPHERKAAGDVLNYLPGGDPRPGVCQGAPLWCVCPASPFWLGEGARARIVELDTFWIARYPVTNAQYAFFVRATGHRPPGHWKGEQHPVEIGNHPVVHVTWQDAMDFCQWLSGRAHTQAQHIWQFGNLETSPPAPGPPAPGHWAVRLPTSAEWEKAARGGLLIPVPPSGTARLRPGISAELRARPERRTRSLVEGTNPLPHRTYPWGDEWPLATAGSEGDQERGNVSESDIGTTTPVGMYPHGASPYGVLDMGGNVWEWCLDWADPEHKYKVRRGGAFRYTHEHARCSACDKALPGLDWPYMGFRVVLGPPIKA